MAPARELAFQIFNEAKKFSKALGIRVACVYGKIRPGVHEYCDCCTERCGSCDVTLSKSVSEEVV